MVSKLVKYSTHYRIYSTNEWQDYPGATWHNLNAVQYPDNQATYANPLGKNSSSSYRPKSLFFQFNRTFDDDKYSLNKSYAIVHIKKTSSNEYPSIKAFVGNANTPYNNKAKCTVNAPEKVVKDDNGWGVYAYYKLTNIDINSFKKLIIELDWSRTSASGKTEVRVGWVGVNIYLEDKNASKISLSQKLSSNSITLGEKITWTITATQNGNGGSKSYLIDLPPSCKVISKSVTNGEISKDWQWDVNLTKGKKSVLTLVLQPLGVGIYQGRVDSSKIPITTLLYANFGVNDIGVIDSYGITYTFYNDCYVRNLCYFDIKICGQTKTTIERHYNVTAILEGKDYNVLVNPLFKTAEILEDSYNIDGDLKEFEYTNINFNLKQLGSYCLHIRVPVWSWDSGLVNVNCADTDGVFALLPLPHNVLAIDPSRNKNSTSVASVNIGSPLEWTIRAKADKHNFMKINDGTLNMSIEEPPAYIGCVRLKRAHSADVTASVSNTLIEDRYRNRVYMGKAGDYSEDITMKLRLPPEDVATLEGLVEFDKPVPIDTIPELWDGNPLNHRGWAELYKISNIKKINDMLYECEPSVKYLTHEINTEFTCVKSKAVYPAKEGSTTYPIINTYLVNTHNYGDKLTDLFIVSPMEFYTDEETVDDEFVGVYEIPTNNSIKFTSEVMQPYGNWDFKFRNTLPSLLSEDYDNNWKMAIRLRDSVNQNVLFEHLYHDFQHFDNDGKVVNKCKVTDTYYNGVNYEVNNYSDMYLTKDNFAPLIDSNKQPVVIKMDGTIDPFNDDNIYPDDVEYSVYRVNPSEYDNYDVVNIVNIPEGVDIYDIPEIDPVDPEAYYSATRYLARRKITNQNNTKVDFNLLVKNSTQYVANKKVKITIFDDLDYEESWTKLTDIYGRVSIDMKYDRARYTAYVSFDESEEYRGAEAQFFIDVDWEEDTYIDTLFEYESPERFIAYDDTYTVQLIDIGGNTLTGQEIYYSFSPLNDTQYGSNSVLITDSEGKVDIPIKYNNGTQHLKVWYKGTNNYAPSIFAETITIDIPNNNYTIEADDLEYSLFEQNKVYSGTVTYNDVGLINKEVIIKIYQDDNIITKTVTTNENGVFTTNLNVGYGLWFVDMIVESTEDNSTTYITRTVLVRSDEKNDAQLIYSNDFVLSATGAFPNGLFTVTVTDNSGNVLSNVPVDFEVINEDNDIIMQVTNKTNNDGVVFLPWYSETEDVVVNFSYGGGIKYTGATGSARVNHAVISGIATAEWNNIQTKEIIANSSAIITEVNPTNTVISQITRNGSPVANIETMCFIERNGKITYSKTRTINNQNISATVGQRADTIVKSRNGAIMLPKMDNSNEPYHVIIFYRDPSKVIKGGMYEFDILLNTGMNTADDYSLGDLTIPSGDGNTVVNATINGFSDVGYDLKGKIVNIEGGGLNTYGVFDSNNVATIPIKKSWLTDTCSGGGFVSNNAKIWLDGETKPEIENKYICGRVEQTKQQLGIEILLTGNGAIQTLTTKNTLNKVFSYIIELECIDSGEKYQIPVTPTDTGITNTDLYLAKSGKWLITIKFTDIANNYSQELYRRITYGGDITSTFYNSLPTVDGRIVIDPDNNLGETFGSDVSLELRNGVVSLIDYGMVIDNEALTGGKIFVDSKQLSTQSLVCEIEISYDNVHSQRINPLEGLLQVNTLENIQTDSEEINKYQNIICSPSPVPDNRCQFTRHTNDGTLYFYNSKMLDEVNKIEGVKYLGCPYNQYKGGTDLKSERGISLFNLENGISPVFLDNGLVKVGFHRYSGYVELHRYDEVSDSYFFVNALKIANNPKLKLKDNNYSDDKITVLFGDTEWTMWRGKPYIEVKHATTDIRLLNIPNRVTCETTENSKSMGFIDDVDIYLGKFTPFTSLQEFKKELCIGENIRNDNFSVESLENGTYNILEDMDNTKLKEVADGLFTNEPALKVIKEESGFTGVCFPANGSYVAKPSNSFSLLIQNIYGDNLPVAVKCRGYTEASQIPEKNSNTQVGIWENIQTINYEEVSNKGNKTNYRFTCSWNSVPANVNYIDFILVFEDEAEVVFNQIMLYEGEKGMNYSKDDSLQKATQTEIYFDKTYYANLYDDKAKCGLSIIRPLQTSFTLKTITASGITVFAPYMKLAKAHDKIDKLLLEYVNSHDQIVSIENIGGFI